MFIFRHLQRLTSLFRFKSFLHWLLKVMKGGKKCGLYTDNIDKNVPLSLHKYQGTKWCTIAMIAKCNLFIMNYYKFDYDYYIIILLLLYISYLLLFYICPNLNTCTSTGDTKQHFIAHLYATDYVATSKTELLSIHLRFVVSNKINWLIIWMDAQESVFCLLG